MYHDIEQDMLRIVEPIVHAHDLELVDVEQSSGGRRQLRIVVDTPAGDGRVLVDACAAVSRELGHTFDAEDYFADAYTLEVSSPGVDRVLGREKDFDRVVGKEVRLETREPIEGRRKFRGRLVGFDGVRAELELGDERVAIPFSSVQRANAIFPLPGTPKPGSREFRARKAGKRAQAAKGEE